MFKNYLLDKILLVCLQTFVIGYYGIFVINHFLPINLSVGHQLNISRVIFRDVHL